MLACTLRVALPLCRLARFATRRPHALRDTCPAPRHHTASSTLTLRRPNMSNILQAAIARDKQKERPAPKPAPQASARASQPVIQKAFRSPPQYGVLRNSRPQYPTSADPFTSTSSSQKLLPSPPPSENRGSRHSSSKSSGEKDKLSQVCNNSSAFQDIDSSTTRTTVASSSIASLHDAVYFDMDDFDDDLTLDFDVDEPLIAPALKAAVASLPPAQPCMPPPPSTPKHLDAPDSSAPLPWSSSPIPYRQQAASRLPAKIYSQDSITLEKRAKQQAVAPAAVVQPQPREEPPSRLTKPSRRIPWLAKQEEDFCEVVMEKTKTTTSDRSTKVSSERVTREAANKHKTPLKGPSMPWDMSASAVKASRNVIRVQKRSVSTLAGDDLEGPLKKVKPDQPAPMFLSEEQRRVIHMVRDMNKSVFFTGSAGTGKSVLLRQLIQELRTKYSKEPDRVAVTASTGLAACNIGGVTLHSYSGIGLGKEPSADLVKRIKKNQKAKNRWLRTKVLIIDEISMVDGELFDKLEAVARQLRNNGRPFGGIQLVITGDFFQLPPVPDKGKSAKFAFEASSWGTSIEHTIGLTQVFRQRDSVFADMLNEMRIGKISAQTNMIFQELKRDLVFDDGIQATELFPTRGEVDAANMSKMRLLQGETVVFNAIDSGTTQDKVARDKLLSNCMAAQKIELKPNAQVMLIKNMDETLVNGSLGRVVGFMSEKTWEMTQQEGGLDSFDDTSEGFDRDEEEDLLAKRRKRIKAQLAALSAKDNGQKYPLVQFAVADGTTRQVLVQPETWKVELPNGEVQAARMQLPLILAWALSIHKAQGQTLERVKVDLGKVFEKGQAYVALSRATCKEGLQVLRFDERKVMAHEKVRSFYASLYSAVEAGKKAKAAAATTTVASKVSSFGNDSDDEYDEYDSGKKGAGYGVP